MHPDDTRDWRGHRRLLALFGLAMMSAMMAAHLVGTKQISAVASLPLFIPAWGLITLAAIYGWRAAGRMMVGTDGTRGIDTQALGEFLFARADYHTDLSGLVKNGVPLAAEVVVDHTGTLCLAIGRMSMGRLSPRIALDPHEQVALESIATCERGLGGLSEPGDSWLVELPKSISAHRKLALAHKALASLEQARLLRRAPPKGLFAALNRIFPGLIRRQSAA